MIDKYIERISGFSIFAHLDPDDISHTLKCIGGFAKEFESGNYIVLEGDQIDCVGIVISGTIHMIKEDIWGNKTILAVSGKSEIFGESYVFGGTKESSLSFLSVEKSEILFLPFRKVLHTCSKSCTYHQQLIDNMVSLIAYKNLQLTDKLEITTKRSLRTKILTYLSQESKRNSSKYFTIPLGRMEMADFLCVDRCALTRELKRMKDEGVLDYDNNTFRLMKLI